MQVNPMQLIQMIQGGSNPQQLVMNMLESQAGNSPLGQNLMTLAKGNNTKAIENIARNICQSQGVDFDKEFGAFQQMLRGAPKK